MTKKKMEPPKRLNMSLEEIILEDKKQKRNHVQRPIVRKRHSSESSEQPSFSNRSRNAALSMALSDHIEKKDVIQDGDYEPNRRGKPLTASTRMDLERIVKPIRTRRSGEPSSLKIIARNVPTSQATRNNHATSIEYSYETRLVISNLHYDVTREDLQDLFKTMGDLERVSMRYDISGRSTGEAEVQFHREADALKAYKAFNGRVLDGQAMDIQLTDARPQASRRGSFDVPSGPRRSDGTWVAGSALYRRRSQGLPHGSEDRPRPTTVKRRGPQLNRPRHSASSDQRSLQDLDNELDAYMQVD